MKSVKDEGIVTQLAVVATMMPKVKKYIDQQADRIAELEKALEHEGISVGRDLLNGGVALSKKLPQTKPLSDEEIDKIIYSVDWAYDPVLLVRAIEERYGIK